MEHFHWVRTRANTSVPLVAQSEDNVRFFCLFWLILCCFFVINKLCKLFYIFDINDNNTNVYLSHLRVLSLIYSK